jgi:hypothetical protein
MSGARTDAKITIVSVREAIDAATAGVNTLEGFVSFLREKKTNKAHPRKARTNMYMSARPPPL